MDKKSAKTKILYFVARKFFLKFGIFLKFSESPYGIVSVFLRNIYPCQPANTSVGVGPLKFWLAGDLSTRLHFNMTIFWGVEKKDFVLYLYVG